jgi:hypothetical protein
MAIRWDEFPHNEIRLKIYARIAHNAAARSAEDSLRHILQRRLPSLKAEDHRRFIELEASSLVEHLRCTRDIYQEFVNKHNCHPVLEAHWVVLRCAVFPTAVALLREHVIKYAKLTRSPGRDLSILFGTGSGSCAHRTRMMPPLRLMRNSNLLEDLSTTVCCGFVTSAMAAQSSSPTVADPLLLMIDVRLRIVGRSVLCDSRSH